MKQHYNFIRLIALTVVLLLLCAAYYMQMPQSSSWLHKEDMQTGNYRIGRLDFWLNGVQDTSVPLVLNLIAPTRFFQTGVNRDANFDMVVEKYHLTGANKGDCDLKVDLSITDLNSSNTIYYVVVPANCQDANYLAGHYRDYLDSVFSGYTLDTPANCRIAMNAVNQIAFNTIKGTAISVGQSMPVGDVLIWTEYDNAAFASSTYLSVSYPITFNMHSYQNYITGP